MIGLLFVFGVCNFCLGLSLAVSLAGTDAKPTISPTWGDLLARGRMVCDGLLCRVWSLIACLKKVKPPASAVVEDVAATSPGTSEQGMSDEGICSQLSQEWQQALAEADIQPNSFVEAAAHIIRLDVGTYRERLVVAQDNLREANLSDKKNPLVGVRYELIALNKSWLAQQRAAADCILARRGAMGVYEDAGKALEEVLLDQAALIETAITTMNELDLNHDLQFAAKRIGSELLRLIDTAHLLRDRMHDLLGTITREENRQPEIKPERRVDPITELPNRMGLECVFWDWQQVNLSGERVSSLCLIDIDRVGTINEQLGTRFADQLLAACCLEVKQLLRGDRGFDQVIRLEGERLLLFLGDTTPRQALACLERIRQALEAVTFECGSRNIDLTVSGSVCEWKHPELATDAVARLKKLLVLAKNAGRNRVVIDENGEATVITKPPQFPVRAKTVPVNMPVTKEA